MSESAPAPTIIHADPEHRGLRLALILLLLTGVMVGYVLLSQLLSRLFPELRAAGFLACAGAVPLGLLVSAACETVMKRTWHSGHFVEIYPEAIDVVRRSGAKIRFDRGCSLTLTRWCFLLGAYPRGGRERRVSARWYCAALQLRQDDARATFHCYLPSEESKRLWEEQEFRVIDPSDVYDRSLASRFTMPARPELPPEVIAGKDGRYWLAERERWLSSMELTPKDFLRFLEVIHTYEIR